MTNLRDCLQRAQHTSSTHPGLWLDKYLPDYEDGRKQSHVAQVSAIAVPDAYLKFFDRWRAALTASGAIIVREATVQGRLSIGLGGEGVLETAITLHHTYGIPYIPGSALKGLAANYARNRLNKDDWNTKSDAYKVMFGETDSAGYVTFFDALYVPNSGRKNGGKAQALWPDVITVHHPKYYQGDQPPADWDSPTPVPFLSATGTYLLAIGGPADWVEKAFEILACALAKEGVGAKTSSGYGRMTIDGMECVEMKTDGSTGKVQGPDPELAIVEQLRMELDQMPTQRVASEIPKVVQHWQALEISPARKLLIAQAILKKVEDAKRTKASQGKPWFEELVSYVQSEDQP